MTSSILATFLYLMAIFIGSARAAAPTNGLVGYWNFDAGSGTTAADSSGNSNTATLVGGAGWTTGKIGSGAVSFDGVSGTITIPRSASLNLSSAATVALWIRNESTVKNDYRLVNAKSSWNDTSGWETTLSNWGSETILGSGGTALNIPCFPSWFTNELSVWHHLVFIMNGTTGTVYCDGVNKGSGPIDAIVPSSLGITLGNGSGYNFYFQGAMDEVRIYNRALSSQEVSDVYSDTGGATTPTSTVTTTSTPSNPPLIPTFTASPAAITSGSSSILSWSISGATAVSIDNGIGGQSALTSGSVSVSPTVTTTYTITATNAQGSATRQTTITVSAPAPPASTSTLDQYGGYTDVPCSGGAKSHFYTEKRGTRWVFCTPAGNAFWLKDVYAVIGGGGSFSTVFQQKYGNSTVGWNQELKRLLSWGFNALGDYSYNGAWPTTAAMTTKLPVVESAYHPALFYVENGGGKSLYAGLDPNVVSVPRNFPDVFDPGYLAYLKGSASVKGSYANAGSISTLKNSPYLVGLFSDDTDDVYGIGPGTDFASDPSGKASADLGVIALITAPSQAGFADTKVYTKYALRDFLVAKYGTIAALNAAWGSNYTTFDSNGGWPTGSGLLDENGRSSHTWLGSPIAIETRQGMAANVKTDLDGFLYQLAAKYFSDNKAALQSVAPGVLFFGPTNVGGWRTPARGPILKAAAQYLDVINIGGLSTNAATAQQQMNFMAQWAGDVPMATWNTVVANPDSSQSACTPEADTWSVSTQAARGQIYQNDINTLLNGTIAGTGNQPFVGYSHWQFTDNTSECMNFGLVSLRDNVYDGKEARIAAGTDAWGYTTGGETRDYGDFIDPVITANNSVHAILAATPQGGGTSPPASKVPQLVKLSGLEYISAIPSNTTVTATVFSGSTVLETETGLLPNGSGNYTISFASTDPQVVDIRISVAGYLSQKIFSVNTIANNAIVSVPQLLAGDFNGDNVVNSLDYSIMNTHYNQNYALADINKDGLVNSLDFAVLKNNYGKSGL